MSSVQREGRPTLLRSRRPAAFPSLENKFSKPVNRRGDLAASRTAASRALVAPLQTQQPVQEDDKTLRTAKSKCLQALASFPGILMVLMFGYTYVAIVISGNDELKSHDGFLLGWAQISNIAITSAAGLMGSTKWTIGGANTTSAILLASLLQNSNLETALFIQGISSLFTALVFILSAKMGGLGRLFGDKNANTALYADYVHPSLVMALSHATALLLIKYSLEAATGGNKMEFNREWWSGLFSLEAISVWVPAWILGSVSAFIDIRLQKQALAMGLLLALPLVAFTIVAGIVGLENIPPHLYWQMNNASESINDLDFSLVDARDVARKLPLAFVAACVIFAEAICVYKSWAVVVPERRSVKDDSMSCGVAHLLIGILGGWFGHQTFVESIVNHQRGFRWSYFGWFIEVAAFGGFAAAVFGLQSPPPFPTILLSATVVYLACVFIDIWFLQRLPPVVTVFEWMLSTSVVLCILVFGFNRGMAIGMVFLTLLVFATKTYAFIVEDVSYDPSKGEMKMAITGHISHGNTTDVFDLILEASPKPRVVSIDLTGVSSADSAIALFFSSISLMSKLESIHFVIRHSFPESSSANMMLEVAAESAGGMIECIESNSDSDNGATDRQLSSLTGTIRSSKLVPVVVLSP